MTDRGRHSRRSGAQFYKDVALLAAGIVIVGALVFGGLSLLAGGDGDDPPSTTVSTTITTQAETTIPSTTATTSSPSTASTAPATTGTTSPATTASTAPPTTVREVRPPGEVRVLVLNSTQVTGAAAQLTDQLAEVGYQTLEAANYSPELSDTMVFHADGFALEAVEVTELVGDGTVAPNPELASARGADVVVVMGLSYHE